MGDKIVTLVASTLAGGDYINDALTADHAPAADINITRKHSCGLRLAVAPVAVSSFALLRRISC